MISRFLFQNVQYIIDVHHLAVRPIAGHGIKHIHHGAQARPETHLLASDMYQTTCPVDLFMMLEQIIRQTMAVGNHRRV